MSGAEIIKNVFTFTNLLSLSRTDVVRHWDIQSFQNACNWARYSQKIEEQTRDKIYRDELERQVLSLGVLVRPVTLQVVGLDTLKHALTFLCENLLVNPQTPGPVRESLTQMPSECLPEIEPSQCTPDGVMWKLLGQDVRAGTQQGLSPSESIMGNLVKLYTVCSQSRDRFPQFLRSVLQTVGVSSSSVKMILKLLLTDVRNPDEHTTIEKLKAAILQELKALDSPQRLVQLSDPGLLCEVSARDDQFWRFHLQQLQTWASCDMELEYGPTGSGSWYNWRNLGPVCDHTVGSISNLIKHLSVVLQSNKRLSCGLKKVMDAETGKSCFNIWHDLKQGVEDMEGDTICERNVCEV